ncbi:unnamed protein product, partial [Scytosiphon promiscuus]
GSSAGSCLRHTKYLLKEEQARFWPRSRAFVALIGGSIREERLTPGLTKKSTPVDRNFVAGYILHERARQRALRRCENTCTRFSQSECGHGGHGTLTFAVQEEIDTYVCGQGRIE